MDAPLINESPSCGSLAAPANPLLRRLHREGYQVYLVDRRGSRLGEWSWEPDGWEDAAIILCGSSGKASRANHGRSLYMGGTLICRIWRAVPRSFWPAGRPMDVRSGADGIAGEI